jgi:hypothetical protein
MLSNPQKEPINFVTKIRLGRFAFVRRIYAKIGGCLDRFELLQNSSLNVKKIWLRK